MVQTKRSVKILDLLHDAIHRPVAVRKEKDVMCNGLRSRMKKNTKGAVIDTGFTRMQCCRDALAKLDENGWKRSYHQRLFHDDFLKACTRIFWKLEPPGTFARQHFEILQRNNWTHISQEVLVSTPRRFGKTISVSMFAAAMLFSAPHVEISIYSTCKRISQKLLRNVQKFFNAICDSEPATFGFSVTRCNMEELVLKGPAGENDLRVVNSYPSKVVSHATKVCFTCSSGQPGVGLIPRQLFLLRCVAGRPKQRCRTGSCARTGGTLRPATPSPRH